MAELELKLYRHCCLHTLPCISSLLFQIRYQISPHCPCCFYYTCGFLWPKQISLILVFWFKELFGLYYSFGHSDWFGNDKSAKLIQLEGSLEFSLPLSANKCFKKCLHVFTFQFELSSYIVSKHEILKTIFLSLISNFIPFL